MLARALAVSAVACFAMQAQGAIATFDVNNEGFEASHVLVYSATGGVGNSGFIYAQRAAPLTANAAVRLRRTSATSGPIFFGATGDMQTHYGGLPVQMSWMQKNVSESITTNTVFPKVELHAGTGEFQRVWTFVTTTAVTGDAWTAQSLTFDPFWTTAQAQAAGWVGNASALAGPGFAADMTTLFSFRIDPFQRLSAGAVFPDPDPLHQSRYGVDNFQMVGVPEPASLALLSLGGLLVARRRR